jgi:hypothetical protein
MKSMVAFAGIASFLFVPLAANAAGSVTFVGVQKLVLSQDLGISEVVTKSLDVEPVGWAVRINNPLPHGGCRKGPYTFMAKSKGEGAEKPLRLTIFASTTFVAADGKPDASSKSTHMIVSLQGVLLTPAEPASASIVSPFPTDVSPAYSSPRATGTVIPVDDGCFP